MLHEPTHPRNPRLFELPVVQHKSCGAAGIALESVVEGLYCLLNSRVFYPKVTQLFYDVPEYEVGVGPQEEEPAGLVCLFLLR